MYYEAFLDSFKEWLIVPVCTCGVYMFGPFIIAEIGCNHKGDINIAKQMIREIALLNARDSALQVYAIKFQKRTNKILLSPEEFCAPHPNPVNAYGQTYGEHREFLEFTVEQHKELKECCEKYGIIYSSSVWDIAAAQEICSINPQLIKVPSASNTDTEMLEYLCKHFCGDIHVSLGMTTLQEERQIINIFEKHNRLDSLVLYSCTSGYPVSSKDVCLLEIQRLKELYGNKVKAIGFSGHHLGIAIDMAAVALGAEYIERHFTLNKSWKGTDHAASLEPCELEALLSGVRDVKSAMKLKNQEILEIENVQRLKLKRKI